MKIILDLQYQDMMQLPLSNQNMIRLPGTSWINILYYGLIEKGFEPVLSGKIPAGEDVTGCLIISDMYTAYTDGLISRGAKPFLIFSQESPNISKLFYKTYTKKYSYQYAYLFPGAFEFFGRLAHNINLFWPNYTGASIDKNTSKDIFVGMIASNKQIFNKRFSFIPTKLEKYIKGIFWKGYYKKLFAQGYIDLYQERLNAIEFFSDKKDFSLFGRGWSQINTLTKDLFSKIQQIKPLEIDDKMEVMQRIRFSICFENFIFPGYITEKIFDCFLTGSIPVYYGAPDIDQYVPADTYIDARKFSSFDEINKHLRNMSEMEISEMQYAADQFLKSADYYKFTDKAFAENILKLIKPVHHQD